MSLDLAISTLIGEIYRDVHNRSNWNQVLDRVLSLTGSRFLFMSAVDLRDREYASSFLLGPDDSRFISGMDDYAAELYQFDPTLAFAARNPHAGSVRLSEAAAWVNSDGTREYVDWTREQLGVGDMVVAYTPIRDGLTLGLSLHPPAERGRHDPEEVRLFLMLFQHIAQATQLAFRPPDFEDRQTASLLIDRTGQVRLVSEGARALLALGDGLRIAKGRLHARTGDGNVRIDRAIARALGALTHGSIGGVAAIERPSGRRPWLVKITPLPPTHEVFAAFAPAALIRIVDQEATVAAGAPEIWAEAFGLTATETRLAERLMADDGDLPRVAEELGMRHSTARVHLRNIFDKTGVRGQVALVRLLQRLEG